MSRGEDAMGDVLELAAPPDAGMLDELGDGGFQDPLPAPFAWKRLRITPTPMPSIVSVWRSRSR